MLILGRHVAEAVIIDQRIVATVAVIGNDFVDLGLSKVDGTQRGVVTLGTSALKPIGCGVSGILINVKNGRARLGLEYLPGVSITSLEHSTYFGIVDGKKGDGFMSGGYFSCGDWMGGDKTGSAFFDVLDRIEQEVISPDEQSAWDTGFAEPLRAQLAQQDEDEPPYLQLSRSMLDLLIPPARRCFETLNEQLGRPDPDSWHDLGESRSGEGWQLICLDDLFRAYQACCESGASVVLHFD
jgi:hypothetical protein